MEGDSYLAFFCCAINFSRVEQVHVVRMGESVMILSKDENDVRVQHLPQSHRNSSTFFTSLLIG